MSPADPTVPADRPGEPVPEPEDVSSGETSGDMGVSSERRGPTGPGQHGTDGQRDVAPLERDPDADVLPEQSSGGPETNPDGVSPKAPSHRWNPREDA